MNGLAQHETRHIVSAIDIQLWARAQRRRWFARTCGAPLQKFALRSWVIFPPARTGLVSASAAACSQ
jgi:hypothetical protein